MLKTKLMTLSVGLTLSLSLSSQNTNFSDTTFLPDGSGVTYASVINFSGYQEGATIQSAADLGTVLINIEHSYTGDLDAWLKCPNDSQVTLFQGEGRAYLGEPIDDFTNLDPGNGWTYKWSNDPEIYTQGTFNEVLSDLNIVHEPVSNDGVFKIHGSTNSLLGCPINGDWTLLVQDNLASDNGYIFGWTIQFSDEHLLNCDQASYALVDLHSCAPFTYTHNIGNVLYSERPISETGTYIDTLFGSNHLGCDSIVTINAEITNDCDTSGLIPDLAFVIGENGGSLAASVSMSANGEFIVVSQRPFTGPNGRTISAGSAIVYRYDAAGYLSSVGTPININEHGLEDLNVMLNGEGNRLILSGASTSTNSEQTGIVKVFELDSVTSQWLQIGETLEGAETVSYFGQGISMNYEGDVIALSMTSSDQDAFNKGIVKVYHLIDGEWIQKGTNIIGSSIYDGFGENLVLNDEGNRLFISSSTSSEALAEAGKVEAFEFENEVWTQLGGTILGAEENANLGYAIDIDSEGTNVSISSFSNSVNNSVQILTLVSNEWVLKGELLEAESLNSSFGKDISLSGDGNRLVVSHDNQTHNGDLNTGSVNVYNFKNESWHLFDAPIFGKVTDSYFGSAVSLSNDGARLAVGAPQFDNNNGKLALYDINDCEALYGETSAVFCESFVSPSGMLTIEESGFYIDTLVSIYGCDSIVDLTITDTEFEFDLQFDEDILTLNNNGVDSVQWLNCSENNEHIEGETTSIFRLKENGSYAVQVTVNNCQFISECVEVRNLSLNDFELKTKIYPNPSKGKLNIEFATQIQEGFVKVFDYQGRLVSKLRLDKKERLELDLPEQSGTYLINVVSDQGGYSERVIKE